MKYGCDRLGNPIEQLLEAQKLRPKLYGSPLSFRQERRMDPDPEIPQQQGDGDEDQPQMGVSRAGINPRLPQLAEARLDAETFAVALADLGRGSTNPPGRKEQFLLPTCSFLAVVVSAVGHTHREGHLRLAVFHCV